MDQGKTNSLPLALKVAALEQAQAAQSTRIAERAEAVEKLANALATATTAENAATARLLETKLSGVDQTLADSIASHAQALELQAKEYERRFGILDRGLERLERSTVNDDLFKEVEKQRRDDNFGLRSWQDTVDKELNVQRGRNSERSALVALAFSVLSFLGMLVMLFLAFGHRTS